MREDWTFNKEVTKDFEKHIANSIPGYNDMIKIVNDICAWFIKPDTNVYDLGSSKGNVLRLISNNYVTRRNINYYGYEIEKHMNNNNYKGNVHFINDDLSNVNSFNNPSVIMSLFTLQFLTTSTKERLLGTIFNSLNDGGAFIFAEKVKNSNSTISEINKSLLLEHKVNNGLTPHEILTKDIMLRGVMNLTSISDTINKNMLLGYGEGDIIFKNNDFVLYLFIK